MRAKAHQVSTRLAGAKARPEPVGGLAQVVGIVRSAPPSADGGVARQGLTIKTSPAPIPVLMGRPNTSLSLGTVAQRERGRTPLRNQDVAPAAPNPGTAHPRPPRSPSRDISPARRARHAAAQARRAAASMCRQGRPLCGSKHRAGHRGHRGEFADAGAVTSSAAPRTESAAESGGTAEIHARCSAKHTHAGIATRRSQTCPFDLAVDPSDIGGVDWTALPPPMYPAIGMTSATAAQARPERAWSVPSLSVCPELRDVRIIGSNPSLALVEDRMRPAGECMRG